MLGALFQHGLVPLSEAALRRAIELNGVAVETNQTAFALGRLAVAAPDALARLAGEPPAARDDGLEALVERRARFLADYQDQAYARRYRATVERVQRAEAALGTEAAAALPLSQAVARNLAKLLAIKDEYEVARLYTDGEFERRLAEQFDGWQRLAFHMAPPLLARRGPDGRPRKLKLGPWLMPAMRLLARARRLRGGPFDVFGHTEERRLERQLVRDYEATIDDVLRRLDTDNHSLAVSIAQLPAHIRGYGHVKLANVATVRARWSELMQRWHAAPNAASAQAKVVIPIASATAGD
jgi:indolepyruvate ferredoxin oxidoreductase